MNRYNVKFTGDSSAVFPTSFILLLCQPLAERDGKNLLLFLPQVFLPLLLLLSEKGCTDFSAQPFRINLEEHQEIAHQTEASQQDGDPPARRGGCGLAERRLWVVGPHVLLVEVYGLPSGAGVWDDTQKWSGGLQLSGERMTLQGAKGGQRCCRADVPSYLVADIEDGGC